MNKLALTAEVIQIEDLRYTPAGIPLLSFVVRHVSEQVEAGMKRKVECEVTVKALGAITEMAKHLKVGEQITLTGFLAKRSAKSTQLVMHLSSFEAYTVLKK